MADVAVNNLICSSPTQNIASCDTNQKYKYNCKRSDFKKFIVLNDHDMEVLRKLSHKKKVA